MAEINRQRKKGIPVWVMLLALIVIALLVWFFLANPKREHAAKPENVIELRAPAPPLRDLRFQQVDRQLAVG
jgi:type VI protein secretion system component VasF